MHVCVLCGVEFDGDVEHAFLVNNVMYYYCSNKCGVTHIERVEGLELLAQTDLGE